MIPSKYWKQTFYDSESEILFNTNLPAAELRGGWQTLYIPNLFLQEYWSFFFLELNKTQRGCVESLSPELPDTIWCFNENLSGHSALCLFKSCCTCACLPFMVVIHQRSVRPRGVNFCCGSILNANLSGCLNQHRYSHHRLKIK